MQVVVEAAQAVMAIMDMTPTNNIITATVGQELPQLMVEMGEMVVTL